MNHFFSAWCNVAKTSRSRIAREIEEDTTYRCNETTLSRAVSSEDTQPRYVVVRGMAHDMVKEAVTAEVAQKINGVQKSDLILADIYGNVYAFSNDLTVCRGCYRPA